MDKQLLSHDDLRTWLTRRELFASIMRLQPCQRGHLNCSTKRGGPCFEEVFDKFSGMARDRAQELVTCGASRGEIWKGISRDFPVLQPATIEQIIEDAFSQGLPTPEH